MKSYRVAIVGCGSVVGNHMRALRAAGERVDVIAAVDIVEDRVKSFCAEYHIPNGYTNTTDMLSAIQPDLVHITTPTSTHFDLTVESLRAGAWVLCEKPLCASLAQFDQLEKIEASIGKYIGTVFQWRFGSGAKHLKRLMDAGELGRPLVGVCDTLWYRGLPYYIIRCPGVANGQPKRAAQPSHWEFT